MAQCTEVPVTEASTSMKGFSLTGNLFANPKFVVQEWSDGKDPRPYYTVDIGDGVSVLTMTNGPERQVLLQDTYKVAAGKNLITCQAGRIDKKFTEQGFVYLESVEDAAKRETKEESNVSVVTLIPLGTLNRVPASTTSREHCFLARVDQFDQVRVNDFSEKITLRPMAWDAVKKLVVTEPERFDVATLSVIMRAWAYLKE